MPNFFEEPILNSPYDYPARHWELDEDRQPTNRVIEQRRRAEFITAVPKPRRRRGSAVQAEMAFDYGGGLSTEEQQYDPNSNINEIRRLVDEWRALPNPDQWHVTPETARLLQHWRHHNFSDIRPFFCQVEAVETAIWLTEVAPRLGVKVKDILDLIRGASEQANPELVRTAFKLATGAGKTTVMAMVIAWQTINAVRHPTSNRFTRGFLVVTPGITVRDRLRVLQPNDPDSYYRNRELIPADLMGDLGRARIVITNYHAFKLRERMQVAKGTRDLIQGRGPELSTVETEGQMLQRVMPSLMNMKRVLVLNDEAHHCYRERPSAPAKEKLTADEKQEAKRNNEAARLWISGIETVKRQLGLQGVYDLSATPFFLRGSGYVEGTIFPWTASDFSLMDAIESGIVKLPRVPIADNIPGEDVPKFRELWKHIGKSMPKKRRGVGGHKLDPLKLPTPLYTALEALYGHYEKVFQAWEERGHEIPPVFVVVCNNTASSELIYEYISGFHRPGADGEAPVHHHGRLPLFRNYDEHGNRLARPRTLLIDSAQLESGDALDKDFREMAADEIERFRRELVERTRDSTAGEKLTDQDLLREVMNTVGKKDRLGESIRCVVSVSMLTEGWDAQSVTHILGVRAFGTQLLCEQVVGRALRRLIYSPNEQGFFDVEYADVLGIPFDFNAKPVVVKPKPPPPRTQVRAVRPDRDALEITFPRVDGYRVELPEERLTARFGPDSVLTLTPELVGPSVVHMEGILGEGVILTVDHLKDIRRSTILFHLTKHLIYTKFRDPGEAPKLHLFGQLKRIAREWLDGYLVCKGNTQPAQLLYLELADRACERIKSAITESMGEDRPVVAILDPYNPTGSTNHVNFSTSKTLLWKTDPRKCHINWVVCDSDWEAEFCRVVESHPRVLAYVKNQNLGLEVPYVLGSVPRRYLPDFIVRVDDGRGPDDPLNLIVEIKGYRGEDAIEKANTMRAYWVPGVNHLGRYGRWGFAEFREVYEIEREFNELIESLAAAPATLE